MPEDVQFMLGRLEAKVDTILTLRTEDIKATAKLEGRVSELEKFRWKLAGMTTLAIVVTGILTKIWR